MLEDFSPVCFQTSKTLDTRSFTSPTSVTTGSTSGQMQEGLAFDVWLYAPTVEAVMNTEGGPVDSFKVRLRVSFEAVRSRSWSQETFVWSRGACLVAASLMYIIDASLLCEGCRLRSTTTTTTSMSGISGTFAQ